jgi:catechol 2,3-dioxygenase-like lactoylglutathione lyase family enzyme
MPVFSAVDHVTLSITDLDASTRFYILDHAAGMVGAEFVVGRD